MAKIALVVSDVDGTLVTKDKSLTPATRRAAERLDELGIAFTIISSRPPIGMRMLVDPLRLRLPLGAFNGGTLAMPDMTVIEQRLIPDHTAREALMLFQGQGIDVWVYADNRWIIANPDQPRVPHEIRTIQIEPALVHDLTDCAHDTSKVVGVSDDHDRLTACQPLLTEKLNGNASINRSQPYYLDVTPPGVNKGTALRAFSERLRIPLAEIVTIGDMENDMAMFRVSGFSIAMGNANDKVKACATASTASNENDGFAAAVENLIIPWATAK